MEPVDYTQMEEDFYDTQLRSRNPVRTWYHGKRWMLVRELVIKYHKTGDKVVDIGCGNCAWNIDKIPVIGIDVNEGMMDYAKHQGRLEDIYVNDVDKLPLSDNSVDIVIATQVLEHLNEYKETVSEMHRVLKPGGKVIISVPYDTFFSLWRPLFAIQCFLHGTIYGEEYYKNKCGHMNKFSPKDVSSFLIDAGFLLETQFHNKYFTIFSVAEKPPPS